MKLHYFDQEEADESDIQLGMAKMQGYVPENCLLGGLTVMAEISRGSSPCLGCNIEVGKCDGKKAQE